ncbi:hypothetical protein M501DRAFT_1022445 [Patellaria atrata CBS 101060]|uniref:Uncharacterized protein n=1 Tax=Patellaria atrata CBS 101060 TaxID=1346257 RepID=A0A9P4SJ06_9PEZI|nr:hypothetical protein M501DRAFT_1022445 [Patellaria atrata CBS 101060]
MAGNLEHPFPCNENVTFCESSFFKRPSAPLELLSPAEVRQVVSQSTSPCSQLITRPPPVIFKPLGLLGQCLYLVHRQFSGRVPVPEVYGWCKDERKTSYGQLRQIISAWRSLKQHFSQPFIRHVGRQPLLDAIFTNSCSPTGWERSPHPYRSFLPDGVPIIIPVIDWHRSGWYPGYWEYCKARWTSKIGSEWETKYLPLFVDCYEFYDYWDYSVLARGV